MLGSAVALLEGSPAESRAADPAVEAIAKKIASQTETRKSVELRVQTKISIANPPPPVPGSYDTWEEHFIEMAGKRRCDFVSTSGGKIVRRHEHYWNGSKAAAVTFGPGPERKFDTTATMLVSRYYYKEDEGERMERPSPILFLHVGREPLHRALLRARPMGTGKTLGRDCDLFLFEQVRWRVPQDQLYYLDRETGLPLRVEGYPSYAGRAGQKWHWIWEAESLDKVGKYYIPFKMVKIYFDQKNQPAYTWTTTVQSAEFDKDFPASTFWPAPAPGARVIDAIKNKVVPGASSKSQREPIKKSDSSQAVQKADLPLAWAELAARISLGLGALILVAGLALCWRQRRLPQAVHS
jgi:hypothetical protein